MNVTHSFSAINVKLLSAHLKVSLDYTAQGPAQPGSRLTSNRFFLPRAGQKSNTWQNWSNSSDSQKTGTGCSQERHASSSHSADRKSNSSSRKKNEHNERISSNKSDQAIDLTVVPLEEEWSEPKNVRYREISGWPHLNDCIQTLEVLNIGGTNVLGEFIPFILLYAPRLKSLGQWINTMIYGKLYHYMTSLNFEYNPHHLS